MSVKLLGPAIAAAAIVALTGAASAQVNATATLDLNIRSGPGPQFPIVGVIESDSAVVLEGCTESGAWCSVDYDGTPGWAYSRYLAAEIDGAPIIIAERPAEFEVPVVEFNDSSVGVAGGAVAGALIGGPVGAVAGGAIGAAIADEPPVEVHTYVTANELDPVYLEGEVVVGAGLPEVVELHPIPDYEYSYVYVNGVPAVVDPGTRRIVHVIR